MFSALHLQYYSVRCCHMGLYQVLCRGLPKGQCMDFSQFSRHAMLVPGHWPWVPDTSFLREDCSLRTHLSEKQFFQGHVGETWRREAYKGWLSLVGFLAFGGWPCRLSLSAPQHLSETPRFREEHLRSETSRNLKSPLACQLALFCRVAPAVSRATGSSLRTKIMRAAQSEHSQEGPTAA